MIEVILPVVVGILVGMAFAYLYFRAKVESTARRLGEEVGQRVFEQRRGELERSFEEKYKALLEQWKAESEKAIREDALARSRAVLKGRVAEQLAPFFKEFRYDPSDARFIGDPVDYVVFDGYTKVKEGVEDRPITIVLVEVKTGEATLTHTQRRIREGVEKGLVRFEIIKI